VGHLRVLRGDLLHRFEDQRSVVMAKPNLTADEQKVYDSFEPNQDDYTRIGVVMQRTGFSEAKVREIMKSLKAKGLAETK